MDCIGTRLNTCGEPKTTSMEALVPIVERKFDGRILAGHIGLFAGTGLFLALMLVPPPAGMSPQAWAVALVAMLMAIWWMTEAVPLAITALLPVILFPLLGISDLKNTAASYAHPLIFLFLGGFMLAHAMERWNLHKRIAMHCLRFGGKTPSSLIFSMMVVTAFLSMWVSNTATAMMMLPIGQSIVTAQTNGSSLEDGPPLAGFSAALMLGIAYAATIGGMGTLIGTPPNALFAGFMSETYGVKIGFAQWMMVGLPIVAVLLPVTWLILTRLVFPVSAIHEQPRNDAYRADAAVLPSLSRGEALVAVLMALTAAGWVFRPLISKFLPDLALSDAGIAMMAAVLLFVIPVRWSRNEYLLSWNEAVKLRWDVLILFGGGLALAAAMAQTGLVDTISNGLVRIGVLPFVWLVLIVMIVVVYLGELASNTAMAAIFLPISAAMAIGIGVDPLLLTLPVALAASLGFMLPVATPPNAIIFGSGAVTAHQMLRAGAIIDVVAIAITAALCTTLGFAVLSNVAV